MRDDSMKPGVRSREAAGRPVSPAVRRIADAIGDALKSDEAEERALTSRIANATAAAAVSVGNGSDEYLEREPLDTFHLNLFDSEAGALRNSRITSPATGS